MATDARITSPRIAKATPAVAALEPSPLAYGHLARNIANLTTEGAQLRVLGKDVRTAALVGESVATMVAEPRSVGACTRR
ncbi:MAG: hypothetical protein ABI910_02450 [Gemmatimonadota bacterium]